MRIGRGGDGRELLIESKFRMSPCLSLSKYSSGTHKDFVHEDQYAPVFPCVSADHYLVRHRPSSSSWLCPPQQGLQGSTSARA
jgi:hypothetical protein